MALGMLAIALCSISGLGAFEGGGLPTITSVGEATVYTHPTDAVFWLHKRCEGDRIETAMAAAQPFEKDLREELAQHELHPGTLSVQAPAVHEVNENAVVVSARLSFLMSHFSDPKTGPEGFAKLCGTMLRLAETLGCTLEGPALETRQKKETIREAVKAALEEAYPIAQIAAEAMASALFTISSVRVLSIEWNQSEIDAGTMPTLRKLSCTVKLEVIYVLGA